MDIFPITFAQNSSPCMIRNRIAFIHISLGVENLSDSIPALDINFEMKG
jgi:hypothetical protein